MCSDLVKLVQHGDVHSVEEVSVDLIQELHY